MNKKPASFIWTVVLILTVTFAIYGEIRYDSDPRGGIEKITGQGEYVQVKNGNTKWIIKGADQDWSFTRITRLEKDNSPKLKSERFWVSILKVDGIWITRTKYRYKEGETGEVSEKDKSGKFSANCRITENKIILSLARKKQGHLFRISKSDGFIQINHISIPDLHDDTIRCKRQ